MNNFENPFVRPGEDCKNRFIGRNKIIHEVQTQLNTLSTSHTNLSIFGLPGMGKTSLVKKTIDEWKDELIKKNILPIEFPLSLFQEREKVEPSTFFLSLVEVCVNEMKALSWLSTNIKDILENVQQNSKMTTPTLLFHVKKFFERVRKERYEVYFIMDEFDRARYLFEPATLRFLRTLAEESVSLLLISQRSIKQIEDQQDEDGSQYLYNIINNVCLEMFDEDDLNSYFDKFSTINISYSNDFRDRVLFYCGANPYLLGMLGNKIIQQSDNKKQNIDETDVDTVFEAIFKDFFDYYDQVIDLLKDMGEFDRLIHILFFGTSPDVKKDRLVSYGLIKDNPEAGKVIYPYIAYSEHFHNYLIKQHESSTRFTAELWPTWKKTENALREVITTTMSEVYGPDWITVLGKTRPNLKKIFDDCQMRQQAEIEDFNPTKLLDFSYPSDLFDIICSRALWQEHFRSIFERDIDYWNERKKFLAMCRTPLAHNRNIEQDQRMVFEGYCNEILRILSEHPVHN